ncbi:MAG TPA: hypothetical protein VMY37_33850 [Thermoguttaceae bacterium]|nr:hypothetical protein [Thermoguttaceae bacterium]
MVHGYHVILAAYGSWLPNDPRGSWSEFVGKWELFRFGPTTRSLARRGLAMLTEAELREREEARKALNYPPVHFTGLEARAIGRGFAAGCRRSGYTIWACSILPEHTHLVIARHRYKVEQVANLLKGEATRSMIRENLHPLARFAGPGERPPRMWAEHEWKGYLDSEEAITGAIAYVKENPIREGKPAQHWPFVAAFTGLDAGWVTYH